MVLAAQHHAFEPDNPRTAGQSAFCLSYFASSPSRTVPPFVCVCVRVCTLLVFSPEALLLLLHSLNIKPEKKYSTFVSDIYSASIKKTETVEAQRHERISPSRKGHGERALFLNERWPSEHEPLQSATKKLICHISSSSASSSWGWDHNVEKSWLASFLSFVLSFSCKISFLENNKGFYNSMVCAKHVIICLHCHSAWYIMDAFVSCSLQS